MLKPLAPHQMRVYEEKSIGDVGEKNFLSVWVNNREILIYGMEGSIHIFHEFALHNLISTTMWID